MARARALYLATIETLYSNLECLYTSYNYPTNHIWNCDDLYVQIEKFDGTMVLAKKGIEPLH